MEWKRFQVIQPDFSPQFVSLPYFCDSYKIPLKMQSGEKNASPPAHNVKAIEEE